MWCFYSFIRQCIFSVMFYILDACVVAQQLVIETLPILPRNILATAYFGLQLTTQINQSNRYETCRWIYEGYVPVDIKTFFVPCENRTEPGSNIFLICVEENNLITTSLVVQFRIQNPVRVRVQCAVLTGNSFEELSSINISVKGK